MGRIQQTRYDELLRRTTAQYGGGSKVGEALEDLFPVIEVENAPIELLRATKWIMGMGVISRVAAAATLNTQQLFNPPGSGKLIVVTSLSLWSTTIADVTIGPAFVALADASVPGAERDTRAGQIEATVGLLQREDDGTGSAFHEVRLGANATLQLSDSNGIAVLAPGTGLVCQIRTVALRLNSNWMWRERVAQPEELNF